MNNRNDTSTNSVGSSAGLQRTEGRCPPRRRGSRRPGNTSRTNSSSVESLTSLSSATSAASAPISYEASPDVFFEELSSLIDLSDVDADPDSPSDTAIEALGCVLDRVQSRLLDKHLKTGRLVSSMSTIEVVGGGGSGSGGRRNQLSGEASQRRVRTTLSFASRRRSIATVDGDGNGEMVVQGNESFSDVVAPTLRRQQGNASAAAAGHALLRRS
jgi:hypothetical protein